MRRNLARNLTILSAILLFNHCYNFRKTKSVSGAMRSEDTTFKLEELRSAKITSKQNILLEVVIYKTNEKDEIERKIGCAEVEANKNADHLVSLSGNRVSLGICDFPPDAIELRIRKISEGEFGNRNHSAIHFRFPSYQEERFVYYAIEDRPEGRMSVWKRKVVVDNFYLKENRYGFAALYPFAITYDLIADTIHTIGAPFAVICFIGLAIGGKQPGNRNAFETGVAFCTLRFCTVYKGFAFLDGGKLD
ncbi:hypothetical protein [Leptospira wolffii]|uniref:hypothetical protein n=1 Tax=Leptospira wolffii TaxID=409998 RepID=UPI0012EC378A|nr:hypothetical protein [Leptospira wolffii]